MGQDPLVGLGCSVLGFPVASLRSVPCLACGISSVVCFLCFDRVCRSVGLGYIFFIKIYIGYMKKVLDVY